MLKNPIFSCRVKIPRFHELKQSFRRGVNLIKVLIMLCSQSTPLKNIV